MYRQAACTRLNECHSAIHVMSAWFHDIVVWQYYQMFGLILKLFGKCKKF